MTRATHAPSSSAMDWANAMWGKLSFAYFNAAQNLLVPQSGGIVKEILFNKLKQ